MKLQASQSGSSHRFGIGRLRFVGVAAGVAVVSACVPDAPAPVGPPTTIVVTTTAYVVASGDGVLSLREAFIQATNDNADSTIVVSAGALYDLDQFSFGQLSHGGGQALVVESNGAARATVRQTCVGQRVMSVGGSSVTLRRIVVRGGTPGSPIPCGISIYLQPPCSSGAGIYAGAPLTLDDVEVTDNRASGGGNFDGGGIDARAGATIANSWIHANSATSKGGGIRSSGPLIISGSTFESNVGGTGGGISASAGSVTINSSVFQSNGNSSGGAIHLSGASLSATDTVFRQNNSGGGPGAAIWADSSVSSLVLTRVAMVQNSGRTGALTAFAGIADFQIIDSTISDNIATWGFRDQLNRSAGGIATHGASNITIKGSTIAFNTAPAGGGANIDLRPANGTTINLDSSIISNPQTSNANCELNGNTLTAIRSLVTDATCGGPAAPVGPALGPLAQVGTTWVRIPAVGSPAIDAIAAPCATANDQRGLARPQGPACDQGAIEG